MSLTGRGRLPLTRTLAELEDLFKKYEKAYKKIDMEAYERYKKDVDVKGNWAIETKIHNYNYTKRRIEHYKKNGTDLLETKKNIVYYSKDKQKVEGTKYEGTAKQKPFLTKKVVEDEKIKKKRVRKVLTDEEKIQAKEARRIKKLDKKELQYLEGKAQLGEKLTTNEKQRLKTIQENFVKLDVEKQKQLLKKKEEAKAKKLDAKYEKMKAYIIDANKRIKKDEPQAQAQIQEEEEEEEEEEEQKPQPSLEDLLGFKAEEVKPIKLLVVPKVVKRITSKEDLKKALTKLKGYNEDIKLHEARLKFIDKTRAKLLKQKGNKNTIEEIDKERDLHTKLLNNAINVLENMRKTIHIEDLKIYKKFIKNPDYFEEEPKPKPQKAKPVKETIIPIEDRLRVVAFEKNKELLAETLRRSGLTKLSKDADPETLLKKFLSVNKERQENIVNYYANIIKEFEEENKTYIEEIAEPTNPIYLVKPAEAIPEYIQPEEEYLNEGGEDEDDEEENIFDSEDYANFIENTELRHHYLFRDLDTNFNKDDVKKILDYLKIPYTSMDTLSAFRRDYDIFYQMRMGDVRSNTIDLKSKENKKFVKKVNDEISQMLKVLYLLKNPNLI